MPARFIPNRIRLFLYTRTFDATVAGLILTSSSTSLCRYFLQIPRHPMFALVEGILGCIAGTLVLLRLVDIYSPRPKGYHGSDDLGR